MSVEQTKQIKSNIRLSSNIYPIRMDDNAVSKLSNKEFMSHVYDVNALKNMINTIRIKSGIRDFHLPEVQQKIVDEACNCAYNHSKLSSEEKEFIKDCVKNEFKDLTPKEIDFKCDFYIKQIERIYKMPTHGVVRENNGLKIVNKCENCFCNSDKGCNRIPISRDYDIYDLNRVNSIDYDKLLVYKAKENHVLNVFSRNLKHSRLVTPNEYEKAAVEIYYDKKEWGVKPHIRHFKDGTFTYVCGHTCRRQIDSTIQERKVNSTKLILTPFINKPLIKHLNVRNEYLKEINFVKESKAQTFQLKNLITVDDPEEIIESDINSKILVNAEPGAGKTYAVIERIKYLAKTYPELIEDGQILVLCFTRAAVQLIYKRLSEYKQQNGIDFNVNDINIATFDSFASTCINAYDNAMKEKNPYYKMKSAYSYDEKIALFIQLYNENPDFINSEFKYLIVDEIQDLVGIRANLVQTMLEKINFGFLLLGDLCQSIFDYNIKGNAIGANQLYEWIEETLGNDIKEYEIRGSHRQVPQLYKGCKQLRETILTEGFSTQLDELNRFLHVYSIDGDDNSDSMFIQYINLLFDTGVENMAILFRTNGDAYRFNQFLQYKYKGHSIQLVTSNRGLEIRKELGLVLKDYTNESIEKNTVLNKLEILGVSKDVALDIWVSILKTCGYSVDSEEVQLVNLKQQIDLYNNCDEGLTISNDADIKISTIHKAKGLEFDAVIVNAAEKIKDSNEIKVYYVAATRAKKELVVRLTNNNKIDKKLDDGRYIEENEGLISRIEFGLDDDIDPIGFIDTYDKYIYEDVQNYIMSFVDKGDEIKIVRRKEHYYIVHGDKYIGKIQDSVMDNIKRSLYGKALAKFSRTNCFDGLFVKNIVSICNCKHDKRIQYPYSESGFWMGITISGYARLLEDY